MSGLDLGKQMSLKNGDKPLYFPRLFDFPLKFDLEENTLLSLLLLIYAQVSSHVFEAFFVNSVGFDRPVIEIT